MNNLVLNIRIIKGANVITVELDEVPGIRIREYECHDKSNRRSSYLNRPAVFAEITVAAVHHSTRHDRYV